MLDYSVCEDVFISRIEEPELTSYHQGVVIAERDQSKIVGIHEDVVLSAIEKRELDSEQ